MHKIHKSMCWNGEADRVLEQNAPDKTLGGLCRRDFLLIPADRYGLPHPSILYAYPVGMLILFTKLFKFHQRTHSS